MGQCCEVLTDIPKRQRTVLLAILWINAAMFAVECTAGVLAHSTALLADSIDMLGDATVYGVSLFALARGPVWKARAAGLKGAVMLTFGVGLLVEVGLKLARGVVPTVELMSGVGALAMIANAVCLALLWRRRADDINMRSAWVCSVNDVAGGGAVLLAAAGVAWTGSAWPDIAVGMLVAAMFSVSGLSVCRAALRGRRVAASGSVADVA